MRTALIAGATGLVGGHCLGALLAHYEHVISVGRRALAIEHPRLEQRLVDFDQLSALDFKADDVFSALGSNFQQQPWAVFAKVERDFPIALARCAVRNGARQFAFVSTVDVTWLSPMWRRYTEVKRDAEAAIGALPFHAVHIARPGLLGGARAKPRWGEATLYALQQPFAWMLRGSLSKFRPIAGRDVARALVAAALRQQPGIHVYHYGEMRSLAAALP